MNADVLKLIAGNVASYVSLNRYIKTGKKEYLAMGVLSQGAILYYSLQVLRDEKRDKNLQSMLEFVAGIAAGMIFLEEEAPNLVGAGLVIAGFSTL